ncbi:hypothetical protein [Methylomonas koyamae]|uniref:hypothetical protein n=1 Tax=Methylomonas koyamae TaxID=702114 RepID=UPI0027E3E24B|nr:hypothetical protein [Methylomonas koyamae]
MAAGVFHGPAQNQQIAKRRAGIAHRDAAGLFQGKHRAEFVAVQALGQRTDTVNLRIAGLLRLVFDVLDHGRRIDAGLGVGRQTQGRHAGGECGPGFGLDIAFLGLARLAQAHAQVDEAGTHHLAGRIDGLFRVKIGQRCANGDDFAARDIQRTDGVDAVGRIDDTAVLDFDPAHAIPPWRTAAAGAKFPS